MPSFKWPNHKHFGEGYGEVLFHKPQVVYPTQAAVAITAGIRLGLV